MAQSKPPDGKAWSWPRFQWHIMSLAENTKLFRGNGSKVKKIYLATLLIQNWLSTKNMEFVDSYAKDADNDIPKWIQPPLYDTWLNLNMKSIFGKMKLTLTDVMDITEIGTLDKNGYPTKLFLKPQSKWKGKVEVLKPQQQLIDNLNLLSIGI